MGRKICRRIGVFALAGMMCLGNVSLAAASSILDEIQSTETDTDHAEDISYGLLRGNNLNYGMVDIGRLSSNEINITGITQCHHVCGNVYLEIYLEQKDNGGYSTYKSWEFSKTNATSLTRSMNVIVPSGHYYRVRGYHATEDGSFESTETLTSGILVN